MTFDTNKKELSKSLKKFFLHTILGFSKPEFYKGTYTSEIAINITGIDRLHLKCVFIDGSIVNGIRQPILYGSA